MSAPTTEDVFVNSIPYVQDTEGNYLIPVAISTLQGIVDGAENDSLLALPGRRSDAFHGKYNSSDATTAAQVQALQ